MDVFQFIGRKNSRVVEQFRQFSYQYVSIEATKFLKGRDFSETKIITKNLQRLSLTYQLLN